MSLRPSESPPTPTHPEADTSIENIQGTIEDDDFDLNPDLDEEELQENIANFGCHAIVAPPSETPPLTQDSEFEASEWEDQVFSPPPASTLNDSATVLPSLKFCTTDVTQNNAPVLSTAQQSKFIYYLDNQLLLVQRKFIQQFNDPSAYNLPALILDLNRIVNLVWFSLNANTPKLFGQDEYLIKITGDLQEYLTKLQITQHNIRLLLAFLVDLDEKLSYLVDGYIVATGETVTLTGTERVRLNGICLGLRVIVISAHQKNGIKGYREELGQLFTGVLDRTS
ncbi:hypothetical protein BABINDRAFT_160001 [Babjeviella inositovora NRRL Y-12698]|uniref:Uncharacterized protein n=1 Tax=Babjeviella inositovora NRRL Y-12698 TaxID=984486 RepID=A0A1E3QVT0_9ASCO|nr:uncharacterized protein BABINDRAFT_160001 [Babjeviella inositovora NRRL Y-12698]ODQ81761.1 hypothetical protein BABINDRAFT_160001 [Babjeviella inositovora NRRL Y-12698]